MKYLCETSGIGREVADRIVVFDKGDIVEIGIPEVIFTRPQVERTKTFLSRVLNGQYRIP